MSKARSSFSTAISLRQRVFFLGALLFLLLISFWPVLTGKQSFFSNLFGVLEAGNYPATPDRKNASFATWDPAGLQLVEFPSTLIARQSLQHGEWPLWNPYTGLGRPLMGEMLASLLNPLKIPLLLWPTEHAFNLYLIARLALAGVCLYVLALRVGMSSVAASISGCFYALNDYFLMYLTQWHLGCDAWFPLFLYFALEARDGKLVKGAVGGAVAWACMLLAGNPQPMLIFLCFAFWFPWAACRQAGVKSGWPGLKREALFWALAILLGAGISAPFLVEVAPFFFRSFHHHTPSLGFGSMVSSWATVPWRLFVLPFFRVARVLAPLGIVPLALAAFNLPTGKWRRPLPAALMAFFLMFQLKLLPGIRWLSPLHWLSCLPVYDRIFWIKYQGAAHLCLALLAGLGWDAFVENPGLGTGWMAKRRLSALLSRKPWTALAGLILLTLSLGYALNQRHHEILACLIKRFAFLIPREHASHLNELTYQPWAVGAVLLFFAVLLLFRPLDMRLRKAAMIGAAFAALLLSSLKRYDAHESWPGKAPYIAFLQEQSKPFRSFALGSTLSTMSSACFDLQDVRMFGPYEPIWAYELEYDLLLRRFSEGPAWIWYLISSSNPQTAMAPAMDLLDIRFFIREPQHKPLPAEAEKDWSRVYAAEVEIWENRSRPGRAFWTPRAEYVNDAPTARRRLIEMGSRFQSCAILEGKPPEGWSAAEQPGDGEGRAWVADYSNTRVVAQVASAQPGVVVLADCHYPRWKARLDGRPVNVYRAYGALRGVHVPSGDHTVEFFYDARPFKIACLASLALLLGMLAAAAAAAWRARRPRVESGHPLGARSA